MEIIEFKITENSGGERIDKSVSENTELSRSAAQKLIEQNAVLVNDAPVKSNYKVKLNDMVKVNVPEPKNIETTPENIPLEIIYEDDWLLVVNKPKGMVVHPAAGNYSGTLVNALLYHCKDSLSGINGEIRPGIVHRIDKNTSGLLIVAKNDAAHIKLAQQIKEHSFTREYEAVVHGTFKSEKGTVNLPIGRHGTDRKKMAVTNKNSRNAVTHYEVIKQYEKYTHIRLKLETGRTHQIRVHMAYLGHPVAGDDVYGKKNTDKELCGQCLHAKKIGFVHPKTGEYMEFDSDLPEYFKNFLSKLKPVC
ncbi:MAG: RluA family pseudouridine synthase [Clostridiales bacterium]|nr:RluA family pseudouridine synthase [Clostridiales bacterium]